MIWYRCQFDLATLPGLIFKVLSPHLLIRNMRYICDPVADNTVLLRCASWSFFTLVTTPPVVFWCISSSFETPQVFCLTTLL